jgi:hypothetical protein
MEHGELCFDSPQTISWAKVAEQHLKDLSLTSPDRAQLAQHWNEVTRHAELSFDAPLPLDFPLLGFTALSERGLHRVRPTHLRGKVSYYLWLPSDAILPPAFGGLICGAADEVVSEVGFVIATVTPVSWQALPAEVVRSGSATLIRIGNGTSELPPPGLDGGSKEVRTAYVFSDDGSTTRYLFVRRAADCPDVCCEFAYDVYRLEPDLPVVASNTYGCDL